MIITGAGAGIGRAHAHMYAKLGANVVVNDVNEKAAKIVVDEIVTGEYFSIRSNLKDISYNVLSWRKSCCRHLLS